MKNFNLYFLFVLCFALIFTSCEEEEPIVSFPPQVEPIPPSKVDGFILQNLKNNTENFNVSPSTNYTTLTTSNSFKVKFGPNTFKYANGKTIVGDFTIEIVDLLTKKEMMLVNRPTFTTDGELLVSGGVIYLNAHQNGQQLIINEDQPILVAIPSEDGNPMKYFNGQLSGNGDFGWVESQVKTVTVVTSNDTTFIGDGNSNINYNFTMDSFGWINCDFFYNSAAPLTGVNVIVPEQYNGSNTSVFIYYSDINSIANMHDFNFDSDFDLGTGYSTPEGMDVSFIIISEIDGNFAYNISPSTITNNHIETIDTLFAVSQESLQLIINNLP